MHVFHVMNRSVRFKNNKNDMQLNNNYIKFSRTKKKITKIMFTLIFIIVY